MTTYYLKGFASFGNLASNVPGATSQLGQLSTYGQTFTKDRAQYYNATYPDITLTGIASHDDTGTKLQINATIADQAVNVCQTIYNYAVQKAGEIYQDELQTYLLSQFETTASSFICGNIVTNGTIYMPEFVQWTMLGTTDNFIKFWFSDSAFTLEYDEYEITVIPPLDNLDDFFLTGTDVATKLASRTLSDMAQLVQAAKNKDPETVYDIELYNYSHPLTPDTKISTAWNVLIYGIAGDNIDAIQNAIVDYVLANSTHTRDEWKTILPDLFRHSEFIILPRWDKYAIPDKTVQAGIYSPFIELSEALTFAVAKIPSYPSAHIQTYLNSTVFPYRSINLLSIGCNENLNNKYQLTDIVSDFINVGTGDPNLDFNRMTQNTQAFSNMLSAMLVAAESATLYSSLPTGMSRVTRDGIMYIVQRFMTYHLFVAAKLNYPG